MIQAIETSYKGYRFRSRAEARWAIFWDEMGYKWEYEPEGFVLPDGTHYLPDFRLWTPQQEPMWAEIKGAHIEEDAKFTAFCEALYNQEEEPYLWTPHPRTVLLSGTPYEYFIEEVGHRGTAWRMKAFICPRCGLPEVGADPEDHICIPCDWETPSGGGHPVEVDGFFPYRPHKGAIQLEIGYRTEDGFPDYHGQKYWEAAEKIRNACIAARSARFEHSERRRVWA